LVGRRASDRAVVVGVTEVDPQCPIRTEHPLDLTEHIDQSTDKLAGRFLQSDLPVLSVVPQPKVGGTGADRMDGCFWKQTQGFPNVLSVVEVGTRGVVSEAGSQDQRFHALSK
jgi:hypothetical protein